MTNTKHSTMRIRGRMGLTKKSADRQIELAVERGIHYRQMAGRLRKWTDSVILHEKKINNPIAYNNHLFLFKDDVLITTLPIPANLLKDVTKMKKTKVKFSPV